jgi:phosphoglycolate phosphatase-like HAD superfamily hydrolase
MVPERHYLFDWGDTLMVDVPGQTGPMCDWPEVHLVEGAAECLAGLSASASGHLAPKARDSDRNSISRALQRAGIDVHLTRIFCSQEVGCMKPDPAYFAFILESLGCPPQQITMVGDTLKSDILGAMNCGLQAIWYNPTGLPVPESVTSIGSLAELVG